MELGSFRNNGLWAQEMWTMGNKTFHMKVRKNFTLKALGLAAQRNCGVSFSGDVQNPPGFFPL